MPDAAGSWARDAHYVTITIGASGITVTLVDAEDMVFGESPVSPGAGLVEFINGLFALGFVSGAVSTHAGRGEIHIYFVRREID